MDWGILMIIETRFTGLEHRGYIRPVLLDWSILKIIDIEARFTKLEYRKHIRPILLD